MESPPFEECPCELCQGGRHRKCWKQRVLMQPTSGEGWLSHYEATYTCPPTVHPRSSKRPPCTPPHPNPPPMDFQTTQRAEFIAWAPEERPRRHQVQERCHQHPQEPFQGQTHYRRHFPAPAAALPQHLPAKAHGALVQHTSSSKEGSQGSRGGREDPQHPSLVCGERRGIAKSLKQAPAEYMTNYQSDFPARRSFLAQTALALPPLDNLAINRALSTSFKTVQRESYRSWDASAYTRDKPTTLKEHQGTETGGKREGATVTKLSDHPPVPVKLAGAIRQPATTPKSLAAHKFFLRDWGAQPRVGCGAPWEGIRVCSLGNFESQTTTSSPYLPEKTDKAKRYKPDSKPVQIEGKRDFATVHREACRPVMLPICCLQRYLIQQQKSRKEADFHTTRV